MNNFSYGIWPQVCEWFDFTFDFTKENETIFAIGTAYVQGEDVGRGRVLLFFVGKNIDNPQNLVFYLDPINL
jgi:hypothetical protein